MAQATENRPLGFLGSAYQLLIVASSSLQSVFLLGVRLYFGWQFIQTGWGKLQHIQRVIGFFGSLGIPFPAANAWFISLLEVVGGALLAFGLGSRFLSLLFVGDMLVAYITADRDAFLSFFSDPSKFTSASPFTFLFASLLILIFGPGKIALDALTERRLNGRADMPSSRAAA